MTVAVTYWEVIKVPDGSNQAWHGEVIFNMADAPDWIKPYLESRVMHVPEATFHDKHFNAYQFFVAVHPTHEAEMRKRRAENERRVSTIR